MLDLFRKKGLASVIYTALIGAVAVVFLIQFRPNSNSPVAELIPKCIAKVRGTCIKEPEWRTQRYLLQGGGEHPIPNINKAALDSLVERALLIQEAQRLGVRVAEEDVMNEIIRWRVYVTVPVALRPMMRNLGIDPYGMRFRQFGTKDKPFDQDTFNKVVQAFTGQNTNDFVDNQRNELLAARMLLLVAQRVHVSDVEAFEQYKQDTATTTLQYVRFSPAYLGEHFVAADQAAIEKWAADHKTEVDAREKGFAPGIPKLLYDVRQVHFDFAKDAPQAKKDEAKKKAEALEKQLSEGKIDFAKAAKDSSGDLATKDKGGSLGWKLPAELPPALKDAVGKLEVGKPTIVEGEDGVRVVELLAKLDGTAAVAFPLYREARGVDLAKDAAARLSAALVGKLPVVLDDGLKKKIEDAKKSGKSEVDATAAVTADEARARLSKAVEDVLVGLAKESKTQSPWQSDERKARVDETGAFGIQGSPIPGAEDPKPIHEAAAKLTKEAPIAPALTVGKDTVVLVLRDRHVATHEEYEKDKPRYLGRLLFEKREDAITNFQQSLRDALPKGDLTIDPKYTGEAKPGASGGPPEEPMGPPPMPEEP